MAFANIKRKTADLIKNFDYYYNTLCSIEDVQHAQRNNTYQHNFTFYLNKQKIKK